MSRPRLTAVTLQLARYSAYSPPMKRALFGKKRAHLSPCPSARSRVMRTALLCRVYIDFTVFGRKTQHVLPHTQIFGYFHNFVPPRRAVYAEFHRAAHRFADCTPYKYGLAFFPAACYNAAEANISPRTPPGVRSTGIQNPAVGTARTVAL